MPTLIGLSGLGDKIPGSVQGENYADYLLTGNHSSPLPQSALYIRNLDGDKDENGKVTNYFPETRGVKTADYTLALSIDRESKSLKQTYFFHDAEDPYQLKDVYKRQGQYVESRDPVWDAYTPPEKRHGFDFWYSYGTFDVQDVYKRQERALRQG